MGNTTKKTKMTEHDCNTTATCFITTRQSCCSRVQKSCIWECCLTPNGWGCLSPLPTVKNVPKTIARQTKNLESVQFLEKFCMFLVDCYMFFVCSSYVVVCCCTFLLCSGTPKKVLECLKLSWEFL